MSKQLIISVSREFGSGGHAIAEELAERFNLPLYDSNLLSHIAEDHNVEHGNLEKYDELPKNKLFSRKVRGMSNSPQENVAKLQFTYLQKLANEGNSFVVVGRCSETKLKGNAGLVSLFILGDKDFKTARIMEKYSLTKKEAHKLMKRMDKQRKTYHNYYCESKWGHCRNYDVSINSSRLGINGTVDLLETYIQKRMG